MCAFASVCMGVGAQAGGQTQVSLYLYLGFGDSFSLASNSSVHSGWVSKEPRDAWPPQWRDYNYLFLVLFVCLNMGYED